MMTGMSLRRGVGLQPVEDLEAGHVGHDQVEEDDVGRPRGRGAPPPVAPRRRERPSAERLPEQVAVASCRR